MQGRFKRVYGGTWYGWEVTEDIWDDAMSVWDSSLRLPTGEDCRRASMFYGSLASKRKGHFAFGNPIVLSEPGCKIFKVGGWVKSAGLWEWQEIGGLFGRTDVQWLREKGKWRKLSGGAQALSTPPLNPGWRWSSSNSCYLLRGHRRKGSFCRMVVH